MRSVVKRKMKGCSCLAILFLFLSGIFGTLHTVSKAQAQTQTLKITDIILLKQVGYSEAQVIAHIQKKGMAGRFNLSPQQVLKLRQAGVSIKVIRMMGIQGFKAPVAKKPVAVQELQKWIRQKKKATWIKKQLLQRGTQKGQFTAVIILELHQEGLPMVLLRLLYQLKEAPTPRIPLLPLKTKPINPPQIKHTIFTERDKRVAKRDALAVPNPADGIYHHLTGHYTFKVPKGWFIFEDIHPDSGSISIIISPENNRKVHDLKKGIVIVLEERSKRQEYASDTSIDQYTKRLLQHYSKEEPNLKLIGSSSPTKLQGKNAITFSLQGKERFGKFVKQAKWYFLQKQRALFQIGFFAKKSDYKAFSKQAEKHLKGLRFVDPNAIHKKQRLDKKMSIQKVIQANKPSVVSVSVWIENPKTGKGRFVASGTGFVITEDGYVITNHHVVKHPRTRKFFKRFMLNWDTSTNLPSQEAVLVQAMNQAALRQKALITDPKTGRKSARHQRQHIDIAILKIKKAGKYPAAKITPIQSSQLGDEVVAMGFPSEGVGHNNMGNDDITATYGRISRLVRMADKRVNEVQHTAKIAGGNSGGPLFNPHTGGVIGINTWVGILDPKGIRDPRRFARSAMGLGYYYAIPINLIHEYFPDYIRSKTERQGHVAWFTLGSKWLAKGQYKPARRAFLRALKKRPSFVPAYLKLALLNFKQAKQRSNIKRAAFFKKARQWADRGMQRDIDHPNLLSLMAQISIETKDWKTTEYLLRKAMQRKSYSWELYALRALMWRKRKQLGKALADAQIAIKLAGKTLPYGHMLHGSILYAAKRYFEGQQAYHRALKIAPLNIEAKINEALGYFLLKQFGETKQKLLALQKLYPNEPQIYTVLLLNYSAQKQYKEVISTFIRLKKLYNRNFRPIDAASLYIAGIAFKNYMPPRFERSKWGMWMMLLHEHTQSELAAQAGLALVIDAIKRKHFGVAYAILRLIQRNAMSKRTRKIHAKMWSRLAARGISAQGIEHIFTYSKPLSLSQIRLALRLFRITPSILNRKTANKLMRKGIPKTYINIMLKVSRQRQKSGIKQAKSNPSSHSKSSNKQVSTAVTDVVRTMGQALQQGDIDTWMALRHPRSNLNKYRNIFWQLHRMLTNNQVKYIPTGKFKVKKSKAYQKVIYYQIALRFTNGRKKRGFWILASHGNNWRLLGLLLR